VRTGCITRVYTGWCIARCIAQHGVPQGVYIAGYPGCVHSGIPRVCTTVGREGVPRRCTTVGREVVPRVVYTSFLVYAGYPPSGYMPPCHAR